MQRETRPAPGALLDRGYLDRLGAAVGEQMLGELLRDGAIEIADRLTRLDAAIEAGDATRIAGLAHDLVSVAGHVGLTGLSTAAADLCRQLRAVAGIEPPHPAPRGRAGTTRRGLSAPGREALAELSAPLRQVGAESVRVLAAQEAADRAAARG